MEPHYPPMAKLVDAPASGAGARRADRFETCSGDHVKLSRGLCRRLLGPEDRDEKRQIALRT